MIHARPGRNGKDASDLVAVLLSNVGALHNQASALLGDVRRVYGKIEVRTAPQIAFIGKFRARARTFGRFGRRTGYVVANAMGRNRPHACKSLSNPIDAIFQAEIITSLGGAWFKPTSSTQIRISS